MKKIYSIITAAILGLGANYSFANQCISNNKDVRMLDLYAMAKTNNIKMAKDYFFTTNCIDTSIEKENAKKLYTVFYSVKTKEMLELIEKNDRSKLYLEHYAYGDAKFKNKRQLLSELLVAPIVNPIEAKGFEEPGDKELFNLILKKYGLKDTEFSKLKDFTLGEEREKLLVHAAKNTAKKAVILKDELGYNPYTYAIYLSEDKVLGELLNWSNSAKNFIFKDKNGASPIHYAFAKKVFFEGTEESNKEKVSRANDVLLTYLDKKYVPVLTFRNVPFWDFIELMKDNNPDLYEKIHDKFSNAKKGNVNNPTFKSMNKEKIEEVLNLAEKVKKHVEAF